MTIVINGTTGISGVDGSAGTPAVQGTDTNTGVFYPAADTVGVSTGGSERMRIDSSGNVGIGTSTNNVYDNVAAGRPLVVQSSSSATTAGSSTNAITISNSDTTTNNLSQLNFAAITGANASQFSAAWIACQYGARTNGQYPTGQLIFATSTTLNNAPSEKMRIDSSGNVGIGTSSPATNFVLSTSAASVGGDNLQNMQVVYTGTAAENCGYTAKNYYGTSQFFQWNNNGTRLGNRIITNAGGGNLVFTYGNDTEGMRLDSSGNLKFNSGYGSVATAYGCRAWVNFNGTGTIAIRASGNVSSITDGGVGIYRVNFTSSMPDANFTTVASSAGAGTVNNSTTAMLVNATSSTAQTANVAYVDVWCYHPGNQVAQDDAYINVSVFR